MPRVKRGVQATRKRRDLLKHTKGYGWSRKSKERAAREAVFKAWTYAYRDRRAKKRSFRGLWQTKINAGARENQFTYIKLMSALAKKNIKLNRKMLANLAEHEPATFRRILETIRTTDSSSKS